MTPMDVAVEFIDKINAHELEGLCDLMTDEHLFIDGLGNIQRGREVMRNGWKSYFTMVPDYWIKVERMIENENVVGIFGTAGGTYTRDGHLDPRNQWEVPAAWQAVIQSDRVAVWQVYADNDPIRTIMAKVSEENESAEPAASQ
jgi:hypothetical protein